MEYKKQSRTIPQCLECGDKISYGRADKKFCCDNCKSRYYNNMAKGSRMFKRRLLSSITRNYNILDDLIKSGIDSMEIVDLVSLGFVPGIMTSHSRVRGRDEYCCFDIKYVMTPSRVYSISKIKNVSLNLHTREEVKHTENKI